MPIKKIFFCFFYLLLFKNLKAQQNQDFPATFSNSLKKWVTENPQEKVALQTDKGYYFSGETIWLKAWCTLEGAPTFLSKILYIDLINDEGTVIAKNMYELDSIGSAAASIDLPATLKPGNYKLRSYTLWMLNFNFLAEKNIFIYNSIIQPANPAYVSKPALLLRFFPEGGDLVENLQSKVAFQLTDQNGLPVAAAGYITDGKGNKITNFITAHEGMGYFSFKPITGENYYGNVDNYEKQFPLPAVKKEGIVLSAESNAAKIFVSLERSQFNAAAYNNLYLSATINGKIAFFNEINFDEGKSAAAISKKNLPPGILQLTVFSKTGIPLAERLVFAENYELNQPHISLKSYETDADTISVTFFTDSLQTTSNTLLISDHSLTAGIYLNENIASSLLLSSDIKGYIHNPGYYFQDKSLQRMKHLDLLLMTHGWRRYEWKPLLTGVEPALKYPVETTLNIKGIVTKSDRNSLIKDGRVNFVIKGDDSTHILSEARLTDKGEFIVDNLRFNKKASVYYQGTNSKKETYIVDVKFYTAYIDSLNKTVYTQTVNLDTVNLNSYNVMSNFLKTQLNKLDTIGAKYKNLSEIIVKGKRRISKTDSLNLSYASPGIFQSGMSLDPSSQNANQNIWLYLRSQIPGLVVEGGFINPTVSFNRYNALQLPLQSAEDEAGGAAGGDIVNGLIVNSGGIAFYLNETNVSQEIIETLVLNDIALVKVLRVEAAALGVAGGAIAIYTKKGTDPYKKMYEKTFSKMEIAGYTPVKKFYYQPFDNNENVLKSATILWHGSFSNKQNHIKLQFKKANKPAAVKIVIQGIDSEGNLSLSEKVFTLPEK